MQTNVIQDALLRGRDSGVDEDDVDEDDDEAQVEETVVVLSHPKAVIEKAKAKAERLARTRIDIALRGPTADNVRLIRTGC